MEIGITTLGFSHCPVCRRNDCITGRLHLEVSDEAIITPLLAFFLLARVAWAQDIPAIPKSVIGSACGHAEATSYALDSTPSGMARQTEQGYMVKVRVEEVSSH